MRLILVRAYRNESMRIRTYCVCLISARSDSAQKCSFGKRVQNLRIDLPYIQVHLDILILSSRENGNQLSTLNLQFSLESELDESGKPVGIASRKQSLVEASAHQKFIPAT